MIYQVVFRKSADDHLLEIYTWYEEQKKRFRI